MAIADNSGGGVEVVMAVVEEAQVVEALGVIADISEGVSGGGDGGVAVVEVSVGGAVRRRRRRVRCHY